MGEPNVAPAQVRHSLLAHVRDRHAGDDGEGQGAVDQRLFPFGLGGVMGIEMDGVGIDRQCRITCRLTAIGVGHSDCRSPCHTLGDGGSCLAGIPEI